MTVQLLTISALNVLQHVIHLFLLRYRVSAFWLANVPGVAGIDHMVSFLCALLVTALCFKDVLIFGNDFFQCLRVSETHFCLASVITTFSRLQTSCFRRG